MAEIVYQDRRVLVAVKPAGVLSTDDSGGLPELLRRQTGLDCVRTVHRLDAAVGGLMVLALSRKAASLLSEQVRRHELDKEYFAAVHGIPEEPEGELFDLLGRDSARRITYVAAAPGKGVQKAGLSYRVLATAQGLSLIRIRLHTGRTHQIRVQFASRGLPLVGDRKYGLAEGDGPIALFSCRIGFNHPESGERLSFFRRPPDEGVWTLFDEACYTP